MSIHSKMINNSGDKELVASIFARAGINIDGGEAHDIEVSDDRFFSYILKNGVVGLGEAYMFGWWDCRRIDECIALLLESDIPKRVASDIGFLLRLLVRKLFNFQSLKRSFKVGEVHYDIGVDFYSLLLDKRMTYSCGYWRNAAGLEEAQEHKLELVCRKIGLQQDMNVLDIGCGWGSFARYAAEKYGADVTGVTVSQKQAEYARNYCAGLPVKILFDDYRNIEGRFDRIVSIGMFEHVGCKNYSIFMECVRNWLTDEGLFLLHTMGMNTPHHGVDEWVVKYIFPNAMLPTGAEILDASAGILRLEDWHNLGLDYHKTLHAWHANLKRSWSEVCALYDEQFARMFDYFLMYFAGGFLARHIQLWQIVFAKKESKREYVSLR